MEEPETVAPGQEETAGDAIEKTLELNDTDRRNAMFYNVFFRKKWMPFYLGVFLLVSLGILFLKIAGIYDIPMLLVFCAGGLLVLLALFVVSIILTSRGGKSQRKLTIGKKGITTSAGQDNKILRFQWKDMYFLGKTKKYFYIYIDASQFIIVPKRYYSKEELDRISGYFM